MMVIGQIVLSEVIPELIEIINEYHRRRIPLNIRWEGKIGVGKTTWANTASHFLGLPLIRENFHRNPYLYGSEGYYHLYGQGLAAAGHQTFVNTQKWFINSKFRQIISAAYSYGFIGDTFDRESDGDEPFGDNLETQGLISHEQREDIRAYHLRRKNTLKTLKLLSKLVGVLEAESETCCGRIYDRAEKEPKRKDEKNITPAYLNDLWTPTHDLLIPRWEREGVLLRVDASKKMEMVGEGKSARYSHFPEEVQAIMVPILQSQLERLVN